MRLIVQHSQPAHVCWAQLQDIFALHLHVDPEYFRCIDEALQFAEYVFHTWPKTSCFSTPRLVTRMKTGLTSRMYKMSDWYSFLPPLTLVLLLHDHKFPWQEHVHDRLHLKHQNCTVEIAPNMLWPFGFSLSLALQISKDMIPLRTSKLQKLLVSSYLMALSGPVCVWILLSHAGTNSYTYVL